MTKMTSRKKDRMYLKNKRTGATEFISQTDVELVDWGFHFFVDSELDAYKAAYEFKENQHGVKIEFTPNRGKWMITVFNGVKCS
jgi:hypothetical protein